MKQKGFAPILIVLIFSALFVVAGAGYWYSSEIKKAAQEVASQEQGVPEETIKEVEKKEVQGQVVNVVKLEKADDQRIISFKEALTISPNGKYKAVLASSTEEGPTFYIADKEGKKLTEEKPGSFRVWFPDSTKILLYDGLLNKTDYLDINSNYYKSGLPPETLDVSYSPIDGSILYAARQNLGSDRANIYIRDINGNDKLILEGNNESFIHVRWSPDGKKIAFLRRLIKSGGEYWLMIMNPDGSGLTEVHQADNMPFSWHPDGSRITFMNGGYVWEYKL